MGVKFGFFALMGVNLRPPPPPHPPPLPLWVKPLYPRFHLFYPLNALCPTPRFGSVWVPELTFTVLQQYIKPNKTQKIWAHQKYDVIDH